MSETEGHRSNSLQMVTLLTVNTTIVLDIKNLGRTTKYSLYSECSEVFEMCMTGSLMITLLQIYCATEQINIGRHFMQYDISLVVNF